MRCGECNVIYILCIDLSMDLFACCLSASVCELFDETIPNIFFGVVNILLLIVMEVLVWVEVLCWIDHVLSSNECVYCDCDHSVLLEALPIGLFVYVGSLRAGSQVFALLILFRCVILHTM